MKHFLRILALLALFAFPSGAEAANRFLTCTTTCTITAIDTTIWGSASGGTGASVPGSGDDVILDASSAVGGTTFTATFGAGYNPTWLSVTQSLCTASTAGCILEANTNANTITLTSAAGYTNTGSGTRTLSGGTWVLSNFSAVWNISASATITNIPSISFTSTSAGTRQMVGGGKTYGTVTLAGSATGTFVLNSNNTIGTFTVAAPQKVQFASGSSTTITNFTNVTGSSSGPVLFSPASPGTITITSGNNWTCSWCGFAYVAFTGAGTFTASNSANYGDNSGITITPPTVGGGGGRIIGG